MLVSTQDSVASSSYDNTARLPSGRRPSQPIYWYHRGAGNSDEQRQSASRLSNPVSLCQYLRRSETLSTTLHTHALYWEWARTYDTDMQTIGYTAPQIAVEMLLQHAPSPRRGETALQILDMGCGTGLVGDHLARVRGWEGRYTLAGMDMVQNMLEIARIKKTYEVLSKIDLHDGIAKVKPDSYAAVLCVGVIQGSIIQSSILNHVLHALRRSGILIMTIEEDSTSWQGFQHALAELENKGRIEVLSAEEFSMYKGHRDHTVLLTARKR